MCGILGIANYANRGLGYDDRKVFENLFVADSARGVHGSGVFRASPKGDVAWAKASGNPFDLFRSQDFYPEFWDKMIFQDDTRWLVGHNRFATTGDKFAAKNAHPFSHGHITMVHNGTIRIPTSTLKELKEYDVDSEALCVGIEKYGIEETLSKLDGAYAIAYYNYKEKTLNLIRNDERPLYVAVQSTHRHAALFCSEKPILEWAYERTFHNDTIEDAHLIPENALYTFSMGSEIPEITELRVKKRYYGGYEYGKDINPPAHQVTTSVEFMENYKQDRLEGGQKVPELSKKERKQQKKQQETLLLTPPAKAVAKSPEKVSIKEDYTTVNSFGPIIKGQTFKFNVEDFDEIGPSTDKWMIYGSNPNTPGWIFKARTTDINNAMILMQSSYVEGKVIHIMIPTEQGYQKNLEGIVYLVEVVGVAAETAGVPAEESNVDDNVIPFHSLSQGE